jgi:hypothetical protein
LFLVPEQDLSGEPDGCRGEIEALRTLGIEVRGASTLTEAAELAGAHRRAVHPSERRMRRVIAVLGAVLACWLVWSELQSSPIPLSFAAVANPGGTIVGTPARRADASASELLPPCRIAGSDTPGFVVGQRMVMRLRIGTEQDLLARLLGYQHVMVSLSSVSGIKVLPPPDTRAVPAGAEPGYEVEVRAPEEETLLVWLAKRGYEPFDARALEAQLHESLKSLSAAERMTTARNLLRASAPGVLFYTFRSLSSEACN